MVRKNIKKKGRHNTKNININSFEKFVKQKDKKSNVRKCKLNSYNINEKLKKYKWQKDKTLKLEK